MNPRPFSSLGPALRLLGLALLVAAAQSSRGAWLALRGAVTGADVIPLPGVADVFFALVAIGAGAFFLRHADENTQALAGGERVLPPLTLLRLVQPRYEHPLRELWSRSDPVSLGEPMPGSRNFGALWALGLALALPIWGFALIAPAVGRGVLLVDAAHHLAIVATCAAAFHFAWLLARRQDEAWARMRPSVITVPIRLAGPRKPEAQPAVATPLSTPRARPPPAPSAPAPQAPPPVTPAARFTPPSFCGFCGATLASRRCDKCGAPALAGSFRVLKELGGSGARRSYLAEAPDGAQVVLKELTISGAPDAQALESFAREARTLRELRHPRLPIYVDAFQEEEGPRARLYLAYRYLDGISLQQEMEERRYDEGEVLDLVEEVLEILRHLHGLQPPLIHRDLKPANLVRRHDGSIAVIDFGVARDLEKTVQSGTLVGTIGYMPPEQLAGQVDLTCDLYALGATALQMLVRRPPWEFMDGPELRLPALKTAPIARALLRRMLAPRRAQRFSSARETLVALRRLRAGGFRLPRTALAAAGVAAATVAAVGVGATLRMEAASVVVVATPAPAPTPPIVSGPVAPAPAPPPVAPPALAVWRDGSLSLEEVEAGLRQLPPWLKSNLPWWIQDHVMSLVKRKLLAAEAQKRGLTATGPERERLLARALLEQELRNEGDVLPARALRKAWLRTTDALFAAAQVRLDQTQVFRIEPEKLLGPPPAAAPENLPRGRLEFAARTGLCALEVEPSQQRYGGRCEGVPLLSQAMQEPETLQLIDLTPGSVLPSAFFARYTDVFIDGRTTGPDALDAAQRAEDSLVRADVWLTEATGTLSPSAALTLLGVVRPALRRCLALALWQVPNRPVRAAARLRVEMGPSGVVSAKTESQTRLLADSCASALARPELGGAGVLTFAAEIERKRGLEEQRANTEIRVPQSYSPGSGGGETDEE
jgi:serine/threonine protein kinase